MKLLERESQLQLFDHLFQRIAEGDGVCALLYGEAGIGKTTLVQQFVAAHSAQANILACGCEALFTPRPLGPLVDLADQLPPSLSSALHAGHTYNGLFPAFLSYLRQSKLPTVFIIEDVHWADDSTLDFIRYIARRLTGVRAMLLLTYRDDEITTAHPLRRVLGELPSSATVRVPLKPLSRDAVEELAKHSHRAAEGLFDATGGNPFFVTEVLATEHGGVPPSVLDAVIARLSRLSAPARELLDVCCVVPNRIELAIVDNLLTDADSRIDECVTAGVLQVHAPHLQFRHELARLAVEQSLTSDQRLKLHRRVFDTLCLPSSNSFASLSRLVHHAERGAINKEVLALAPRAAREAAAASAHREAAALYRLALKHVHKLDAKERAKLLEEAAHEYRLISAIDEAMSAMQEALTLRQQTGDALHEGMNLRLLATTRWHEVGDREACQPLIEQALRVLESIQPSIELSLAHSAMSNLYTSWSEYSQAIEQGEIALSIAESLGDAAALVDALHVTAAAKTYLSDDRQARAQLERALAIAIAHKMDAATGLVYMTLQTSCLIYRDHAYALNVGERGIAYCESRDMDVYLMRLYDRRALSLVELGRWDEADRDLELCLSSPSISVRLRDTVMFLRKRQDSRRGDVSADSYWLELQQHPQTLRVEYRLPAIANACAEAAWLRADTKMVQRMCEVGLADALARNDGRLTGPLLVWLKRIVAPLPKQWPTIAPAYAAEVAGDITKAAHEWALLSCPYERALTLISGDESQVREAYQVLDGLGAKPAAEIARKRLRAMGARAIERGPQPRTRTDPLGLTLREREVFDLLVQGMSNADIAARLHRSARTIEHHVATLYDKLHIRSRQELLTQYSTLRDSR